MRVIEDLTGLAPKRLERRLEELAREALPCVAAVAFDGNPEHGLTVGLWVESKDRRDVLDLARVLETEPGGHVATGWSLLSPSRGHHYWRLLLRVHFERPVLCSFVVRFDVRADRDDQLRLALPLLLAASGFALAFNGFPQPDCPATWIPAPTARECVYEALHATAGATAP
jgi:hypothetical protein